jgi:hypothetical protein
MKRAGHTDTHTQKKKRLDVRYKHTCFYELDAEVRVIKMGSKDNQPIDPPFVRFLALRKKYSTRIAPSRRNFNQTRRGLSLSLSLSYTITIRSIYDFFSPFDLLYNIMHTHTHPLSFSLSPGMMRKSSSFYVNCFPPLPLCVSLAKKEKCCAGLLLGGNRFSLRRRQQVCRRRPSGERDCGRMEEREK